MERQSKWVHPQRLEERPVVQFFDRDGIKRTGWVVGDDYEGETKYVLESDRQTVWHLDHGYKYVPATDANPDYLPPTPDDPSLLSHRELVERVEKACAFCREALTKSESAGALYVAGAVCAILESRK